MRKILLLFILLFTAFAVRCQSYNNEWINYGQTYYKFSVGSRGLYRISQPALAAIGLGGVPAEQFQLWRNGTEIPVYISVNTGILSASDFIEFYGEPNDGLADKPLYKYDSLQMNDRISLYTDTAAYFLTQHAGTNKRLVNTINDVAGNQLAPETGFTYTLQKNFRVKQNPGYYNDYGEWLYASSYETGEGWTSEDVYPGSLISNNTIFPDNSGGTATLDAVVAGNTAVLRNIRVKINGITLKDTLLNGFKIKRFHITGIPSSAFSSGSANIEIVNLGTNSDNIVVAGYGFAYPHSFNFEGQSQFGFDLAGTAAKYIEVSNFNFGGTAPILIDLKNNLRLTGNLNGSVVRFAIPATAVPGSYVLLSCSAGHVKNVQQFSTRNFINYANPANQGDYIIISHPSLYNDGSGNNHVDRYRAYRSSPAGGNYHAIVVDINQLTDQFAFGIKHHPSAIRNFGDFALAVFNTAPAYFYLVGKGLNYQEFRAHESDPNISNQALVPTFGIPASDNLLLSDRTKSYAKVSIGRLSAISGTEVGDYLDKVEQFESAQQNSPQTNAAKGWMKNAAQITGAIDDVSLANIINFYMDGYRQTLSDTSLGANVYAFNKNSGSYTAVGSSKTIDELFNDGLSYLKYFGHSSPNTLEFNLDNPQNYNNTGKYPLIMVNGCNTGNLFLFDTLRSVNKGTLSEKYIFANQKGSIGFIADTHFGLPQQLNFFTEKFDNNLAGAMYGRSVGDIMKNTMQYLSLNYSNDFATRIHAEEITYHGDPALKLNPFSRPDYTVEDSLISIEPSQVSIADQEVKITIKILNIGKAVNDSFNILVQHRFPDNTLEVLQNRRVKATLYADTIQVRLPINPLNASGLNKIIVTIDQDAEVDELAENNNTAIKEFTVAEDEIRPVFPYDHAIVGNSSNLALYGSTADPLHKKRDYVMEMDTSRLFNSAFKITRYVTDSGGVIRFIPGIPLTDSTVYYWRIATSTAGVSSAWHSSSFIFINGSPDDGFSQSHFYQLAGNGYEDMYIDSATRLTNFNNKTRKLTIRTGLYPYYLYDVINVNVDNDRVDLYGCLYNSLQFVVYNPLTLKAWRNYNTSSTNGRFGSEKVCQNSATTDTTRAFFEFSFQNINSRTKAMQFLDSIPDGYFVSVTNLGTIYNTVFINSWKADTAVLGSGKSLWHKLHQQGLHQIDSFTTNLPFSMLFKKGDTTGFIPRQHVGPAVNSHITDTFYLQGKTVNGSFSSPWFGPAKNWKDLKWDIIPDNASTAQYAYIITGKNVNGTETDLGTVYQVKDTSLAYISADVFPYIRLKMNHSDEQNAKPRQLKYWMLTSDNYPEGALSPNLFFRCADTLTTADTLHFKTVFKNISNVAFDSITVRLTLNSAGGTQYVYNNLGTGARIKPLAANDTAVITYDIPVQGYPGENELVLDVNPANDQPEQFHFNNILFRKVYVITPQCAGSTATFTAPVLNGSMQWQVDDGNGFVNISDGAVYSGTTTAVLQISNISNSLAGYKYRCTYTTGNTLSYSDEFVLKVTAMWTGAQNTSWENPGNWSCAIVPDAATDVFVKTGVPNYPVISGNAICHSLTITGQATVLVKSGASLNLAGK